MTAPLLVAVALLAVPEVRASQVRRRLGAVAPRVVEQRPSTSRRLDRQVPLPAITVVCGAASAALLRSPALVVIGAAGGVAIVVAARVRARRAALRLDAGLPRLLEDLARHLRAGGSVRTGLVALADAPEHAALLSEVGGALRGGAAVQSVMGGWVEVSPRSGRRLASAAVALGADAGGPQARALDAVAATLRERDAVVQEARALTAQARASAALLAVAPVAFAALGAAAQPGAASFLLREPAGAACLVVGFALQCAGWWWMHRISEVDA